MTGGWYAMHRGWMDHPAFGRKPYSEREAWIWLIENALFTEATVNINNKPVTLQRGQLSYSIRYLAEAWGWSLGKAQRFIAKLKMWSMVDTETDTGQIIITICNYSKYQDAKPETDTAVRRKPIGDRVSSDTNNKKVNNEEEKSIYEHFEKFWEAYPKRKGGNPKKPAREKFQRLVKSGADPGELIAGAESYACDCRNNGTEGSSYVAQAQTWLNQERWKDQKEIQQSSNGGTEWTPF